MLRVLDMILEDVRGAKKYVRDIGGVKLKIFCILSFSNHEGCLEPFGNTIGRTLVDLGRPNRLFLGQ